MIWWRVLSNFLRKRSTLFFNKRTYLLFLVGTTLLFSCHRHPFIYSQAANLNRLDTSTTAIDPKIVALIAPYKAQIDSQMNSVIGYCGLSMTKYHPESELGNAVADMVTRYTLEQFKEPVDLCVLNFGGLRTSLPKGNITKGKVFELMPFDNTLVIVQLSSLEMNALAKHIANRNGEPIGSPHGVILHGTPDSHYFQFGNEEDSILSKEYYHVLTSSYLAGGGDNFVVFKNTHRKTDTGLLIRDALLYGFDNYTSSEHPLTAKVERRIRIK